MFVADPVHSSSLLCFLTPWQCISTLYNPTSETFSLYHLQIMGWHVKMLQDTANSTNTCTVNWLLQQQTSFALSFSCYITNALSFRQNYIFCYVARAYRLSYIAKVGTITPNQNWQRKAGFYFWGFFFRYWLRKQFIYNL